MARRAEGQMMAAGAIHRMNSATARESILASIRENLAASAAFNDAHAMLHLDRAEIAASEHSPIIRDSILGNFQKNLELVGGHLHIVRNEREAADAVRSTIEALGGSKIAISDSPLVTSIANELSAIEFVQNADREFLFDSDLGITAAQWAIAETGTLVLTSDSERHRLTSLVPPVHICVLEAGNIRQTLGEILERIEPDRSRTVTFITGASRTSDIELTLAIGVHGPRELHVVIIDRRS